MSELISKMGEIVSLTESILSKEDIKMSSREIAEVTGKRHDHVLRDIRKLEESYLKVGLPKVGEGFYTLKNTGNQQHREFLLTKEQTLDLVTGYSNELRILINRRWLELEKSLKKQQPSTYLESLKALVEEVEAHEKSKLLLEEASNIIQEAKPLVEYCNTVLNNPGLMNTTQVGKVFGLSPQKLNKILHEAGIQYKDKKGTWTLYAKYSGEGYAQTITVPYTNPHTGEQGINLQLKWTQKGRQFIYNLLISLGYCPEASEAPQ